MLVKFFRHETKLYKYLFITQSNEISQITFSQTFRNLEFLKLFERIFFFHSILIRIP